MEVDRLKILLRHFGYVVLFVLSFFFFLYLTFPYGVLKEALTANLGKMAGLDMRVERLDPSLPLGFQLTGIEVGSGGTYLRIKQAKISISMLNLFIGRLGVDFDLQTANGGTLNIYGRQGIFTLVLDRNVIPSRVSIAADRFDIESIVAFLLNRQATGPSANPMVGGMLAQIGVKGELNGKLALDLNPKDLSLSSGKVDLKILKGLLKLDNKALGLADQMFQKAQIRADMANGNLKIADTSGFETQELVIGLSGDIQMKKELPKSLLNMSINLQLDKSLKDQFGIIIDAVGGSEGILKYKLRGTMGNPNFVNL